MITIYGLAHPRTGTVRYVGKCTQDVSRRLANHEYKARSGRARTPVGFWIRGLIGRGLRPKLIVLEVVRRGSWRKAERRWIAKLRADGYRLLNVNAGGNGAHVRLELPARVVRMLGRIADGLVAAEVGLSREAITYRRRQLGIPKAPRDKSRMRRQFAKGYRPHNRVDVPASVYALLGERHDNELARKINVTKIVIRRRRIEKGVPPLGRWPKGKNRPCS